jgi:hypothetical protein
MASYQVGLLDDLRGEEVRPFQSSKETSKHNINRWLDY